MHIYCLQIFAFIPHSTPHILAKRKRQICAKITIKNNFVQFSLESQQIINDITFSNISQDNISLSFSEHTNLFCISFYFFFFSMLLFLPLCCCMLWNDTDFSHPLNLRYQWYTTKTKLFFILNLFYFIFLPALVFFSLFRY